MFRQTIGTLFFDFDTMISGLEERGENNCWFCRNFRLDCAGLSDWVWDFSSFFSIYEFTEREIRIMNVAGGFSVNGEGRKVTGSSG